MRGLREHGYFSSGTVTRASNESLVEPVVEDMRQVRGTDAKSGHSSYDSDHAISQFANFSSELELHISGLAFGP